MSNDDTGIVVSPPRARGGSRGQSGGGGGGMGSGGIGSAAPAAWKHRALTAVWMTLAIGAGAGGVYLGMRERLIAAHAEKTQVAAKLKQAADESAAAKQLSASASGELLAAKERADKAEQELAAEKAAAEKALADKASEAKALEDKLQKVLAGQGEVSQSGGAIRLEVVDKVLFSVGQSELTERGKAVLGKLGAALAEATDKQIWVQGHTDDQPITPDKGVKPTFASNWELASARALSVVHYLQDVSKVDPQRLAAVAFGQYRPISKKTKAKNRRIEIVLYPKIDMKPR
jgi:chemotaxis protein MotB